MSVRSKIPLLIMLLLAGCTGPQSGRNAPLVNGEGILGVISVDNARVRCGVDESKPKHPTVTCHAVTVERDGSELMATKVADGLSLSWQLPKLISGTRPVDSSCSESNGGLTQRCDFVLASAKESDLNFHLL